MSYINVSIENFKELVIAESHKRLVLLDISANWCSPCKVLEPILIQVIERYNKKDVLLAKLEAEDENMKIAGEYFVRGFPTVIAFSNGVEIDRFHSSQNDNFIDNFIVKNLKIQ